MAAKKTVDDKIDDKSALSSKALQDTVKEIKERFGEGSIMVLGQAQKVDVDAIPTGSISLDLALGVGGIPKGRIVEIYGPESSGKTTLTLHVVAEAQRRGGLAAFIDAEHALDPDYARKIGVNVDNLLISQPDNGEQALDIMEALVKSGRVAVIVIDSVAALTPQAEIEGEMGDMQMGLQARLMSKALRKVTNLAAKSGTTVIFTNQIRMKLGIMFGNPETTPGGNALKFFSSVRMDIRRIAQLKNKDEIVGNRVRVKVVKNKVAAPFKQAEFDIMYNQGVARLADVLQTGVRLGVLEKSGSWFQYGGEKIGQGTEASVGYLKNNPKIFADIVVNIRKKAAESQVL
ncbi:MAG: recombinase RecA [Candidatus Sungbacteria bacterium]|uniref:Protein RecA n=1 Tax=Candidatus Sungiibacteriota bacterium TaxID=2750080 RepID=A0A931YDK5_9BACT|nr:recombinase RecA [Candidatus Sungbacteria bacterium]